MFISGDKSMKKIFTLMLASVMVLFLFQACGKEETAEVVSVATETPEPEETKAVATPEAKAAVTTAAPTKAAEKKKTATPTPTPEPTPDLTNVNPLTGLPMEKDVSSLRPYVFMCNNISVAMPHVGIAQSDLIMEMMEEGGITRMMVFFADPSNVPVIGSIRSARAYNVDTAMGYDAFLVHCGNSDEATDMIANYGMQDIDQMNGGYLPDAFYRDSWRSANLGNEHSLMAVGGSIVGSAQQMGYRLEHEEGYDISYGLSFSDEAYNQVTGEAGHIEVAYAGGKTTSFAYDANDGAYYMYQYGSEYLDNNTERVPFVNVIEIQANTYLQSDGQHLTIDLTEGSGFYFTYGRAVPIRWYKNGAYDVFHYTLEDGTPLQLSRGRTFVAVNQCGSYQGGISFGA